MPETAFYFVLNMSISGSLVIALLCLVRKLPRIPKTAVFFLWITVLLRLTVPAALSASFSIFSVVKEWIHRLIPAGAVGALELTAMNYINQAVSFGPILYKTQQMAQIFRLGTVLWISGVIVLLLAGCLSLTRAHNYEKVPTERKNVYRSSGVPGPMTMGILRPVILLPPDLFQQEQTLAYVLAHEEVHRKRRDNLWRLAGFAVLCLHWFNPLVWLGYSCFFTDMELSCDEQAVKDLSLQERKAYAAALLDYSQSAAAPKAAAFSGKSTKKRILSVLRYRRFSRMGMLLSSAFLLLLLVLLITNPASL